MTKEGAVPHGSDIYRLDIFKSLFKVSYYILNVLDSDGETDKVLINSAVLKLLCGELTMCGACRVQTTGAAVGNVGDYRCKLETVHKSDGRLSSSVDSQ